jgi:hypothetical protein
MRSASSAALLAVASILGCGGITTSNEPSADAGGRDGASSGSQAPSNNASSVPSMNPVPPPQWVAAHGGADATVEPTLVGTGMACTAPTAFTTATRVTVAASWPSAVVDDACQPSAGCSATITFWLRTNYAVVGTQLQATTTLCGLSTPAFTLSALGRTAYCGSCSSAMTQETFASSVWDTVSAPEAASVGEVGGWTVGSSLTVDMATIAEGIAPNSTYASENAPWPAQGSSFAASDLTDSDDDGHVGITATPRSGGNFYPPRISVDVASEQIDALYLVSRLSVGLYGTSTSCTDFQGTAHVTKFDRRVVGCHQSDGSLCVDGDPSRGAGWVDANLVPFEPGAGTFVSTVLPQGASALCTDVVAALPP